MKNILSRKINFQIFGEKKCIFDQISQFSENSPILDCNLRHTGLLKKKHLCEKLILKTMVKVCVYLLGQASHVSAMANFKGTHTLMHVLKKWRKMMKLLR